MVSVPSATADDSGAVSGQERETVRQMEQETSMVQQQARWEQTVREHDRNGDGSLDQGEKLAALEQVRLRNEAMLRQAQGTPANPEPPARAGENAVQQPARDQDQTQIRDQKQMQASETQRLATQQQEWAVRFDADKNGSLSDEEFAAALKTMDRDRDTLRDRLKDREKKSMDEQARDQLRKEDKLQDQDRTIKETVERDRDRLMDRDRVNSSPQPRKGGGRRR
jgi:hypothetical protein